MYHYQIMESVYGFILWIMFPSQLCSIIWNNTAARANIKQMEIELKIEKSDLPS